MSDTLDQLTGKVRRRKFLVLDIESKDGSSPTKPGFTRPFLTGVYDGFDYYPFRDSERDGPWQHWFFNAGGNVDTAMLHILSRRYRGHYIYAHNAGRFDYLFLLPWLMQRGKGLGFSFSIVPLSSAIQVLDVWRTGSKAGKHVTWRFLDSYKLIPTGLDKALKSFGIGAKLEHDLAIHENDPSWLDYNRGDCEQLWKLVNRFHRYVEDTLGGEIGITAPSTAMKLYRRKYLTASIPRSVETHEFIRSGYFGGRVEVFRRSGANLRYYDINSSYPHAMLAPMPAGEAIPWEGEPPARLWQEHIGFVQADVEHWHDIPCLPVRAGEKTPEFPRGKLVFPVGRLSGVWDYDELVRAMKLGASISRYGKSVWYPAKHLFRDFVGDLYPYRDRTSATYDPGLAEVVKILLNSTYGKFGQRPLRSKLFMVDDPELPEVAKPLTGDPEDLIWRAEETADSDYIIPQISAHITALARLRLHWFMHMVSTLGGNLYYVDTDSIITDVELPTGNKLGELKDEYPEHSGRLSGEFIAPKLYLLTAPERGTPFQAFEQVKAKGLQREAKNRVTFEALARGETIQVQHLEKVMTMARKGFREGPQMVTVPRHLHSGGDKRLMLPDGSTKPIEVTMW